MRAPCAVTIRDSFAVKRVYLKCGFASRPILPCRTRVTAIFLALAGDGQDLAAFRSPALGPLAQQVLELFKGDRFAEQIALEGTAAVPLEKLALRLGFDAFRDHA